MQQVAHEPNHEQGLRVSKHIFVGNSRLVTALTHQAGIDTTEQAAKLYYYHADHLQSAQFITNAKGEKYEHIEYTPYGELWIEETAPGVDKLPFRFTGKELDTETGLYYYGARYLGISIRSIQGGCQEIRRWGDIYLIHKDQLRVEFIIQLI